jgi:membrane AbrB-like protein
VTTSPGIKAPNADAKKAKSIARDSIRAALGLAVGLAGGAGAQRIGIPVPWVIGSLLASTLLSQFVTIRLLAWIRPLALLVLGLALGQSFNAPVLHVLAGSAPIIVLGGLLTILSGLFVARLFCRIAGTDLKTGYYCAVPGGVIVMAVQAERAGTDVAAVTFSQSIRMVIVVVMLPLLLTFAPFDHGRALPAVMVPPVNPLALAILIAASIALVLVVRPLKLANPWMIVPCFLSIVLSAWGTVPSGVPHWNVNLAQVVLGISLGGRLTPEFFKGAQHLIIASISSTLLLALLLLGLGLGIAWISGLPSAAVVLGMAPGGMPEMTVTAGALDVAVPIVLGFHLTRVVLCNLLIEPIWTVAGSLGIAPTGPEK